MELDAYLLVFIWQVSQSKEVAPESPKVKWGPWVTPPGITKILLEPRGQLSWVLFSQTIELRFLF